MKRFTKILGLLISMVAILTAFAVVAMATDGTELVPKTIYTVDFESNEVGDIIQDGVWQGAEKSGVWYVGEAENGNKYVISTYKSGSPSLGDNHDVTIGPSVAYDIVDYPMMAFDFDIMSTTGAYHYSATIRPDLYGGKSGQRIFQMESTKFNADGVSVPAVANVWNHVTFVIRYVGDGKFNMYFYVNGESTFDYQLDYSEQDAWKALLDEDGNIKYDNVRVAVFSIYSPWKDTTSGEEIRYDNMRFTYFPEGYSAADAASFIYGEDYELPYGFTVAKNDTALFDNAQKAIDATEEGKTVVLQDNIADTLLINKNLFIDTNVYEDGTATGSFYTFNFKSSNGYVASETAEGSGIFEIKKSENVVTVIWDEKCAEDCDCFAEYGGHIMTNESIVVLGDVPEYFGNIPTFEIAEDKSAKTFAGWSYENDGTVDVLVPVTADDVAGGTLKLYPVYETLQYVIELSTPEGEPTYHLENEFYNVIVSAPSGSIVKLYGDVRTDATTISLKKKITIDLNGHTLMRHTTDSYVNYKATKNADGSYAYNTKEKDILSSFSSVNLFNTTAANSLLSIISSNGKGTIYNSYLTTKTWYFEDEVVKTETAVNGGRFINLSYSSSNAGTKLNIDNVVIYAGSFWHQDSASAGDYYITINNAEFYQIASSARLFEARSNQGYEITVTNTLFYGPASISLMLLGTSGGTTHTPEKHANVLFKNCDFIKSATSYSYGLSTQRQYNTNVVFDNCRNYDVDADIATATNGTLSYYYYKKDSGNNTSHVPTGEGFERKEVSIKKNYTVPSSLSFALDEHGMPTFVFDYTTKQVTFNRLETKAVTVNWVDGNGDIEKTESLYPGIDTLTPPIVNDYKWADSEYVNIAYQWADAAENGKAIPTVLGLVDNIVCWNDEYNFYAVTELDGVVNYVGGIKDAKFNLAYTTTFNYNVYLPIDENITYNSVDGIVEGSIVYINGKAYRAYSAPTTTTGAAETKHVTVSFTYDGKDYVQTFNLSAVNYAQQILSESTLDVERASVANMLRYVKEACKVAGVAVSDKFDRLITLSGIAELGTKESYEDAMAIYSRLEGYVESISFMVDRAHTAYLIKLTDSAIAANAQVTAKFVETGEEVNLIDSEVLANTKITNKTKSHDLVKTIKITVTIPAAEEGASATVVSGTYSIKAYINATDNTLAKAAYEFGVAAAAYRDYLSSK